MDRTRHSILFYVIVGIVSVIYLFTGLRKLFNFDEAAAEFESWGYHPAFMYVIGVVEITGAILLLIPKTRLPGIVGLGIVMLGAIGTHIYAEEYYQILLPLVLLLLLITLFVKSRGEIEEANLREHDQANY
ncbi:MAG TPA: DoxX family protein [Membranihabitans sp.]|nr:DoxX family protein [Membranihabitans sp.]